MANKKNSLLDSFSKENAKQVADEYEALSFRKKPNNILGLFYIAISILSLVVMWVAADDGSLNGLALTWADMVLGVSIYVVLAVFIFLNHRWAMIIACLIYLADKVIFLVSGGFSVGQIIFGFLCLALTWHAFLVANALKKQRSTDISAFD